MNKRRIASLKNGKNGGRPKAEISFKYEIQGTKYVILTPTQYNSLLEKYGYELLRSALRLLDDWLGNGSKISKKYIGKNNYAHFRSDGWLINTAKYLQAKNK